MGQWKQAWFRFRILYSSCRWNFRNENDNRINNNGTTGEISSVLGFDDDIDLAEIEEMERQAIQASQSSQTKVDINTPPDVEEEEFDFEEAENALREQEIDEAEAYLAEQERDMNLERGITAQ